MNLKTFYDLSYDYLVKQTGDLITLDELNIFIEKPHAEHKSLEDLFETMCITLQDYQSRPKIINYFARKDEIKEILYNFNITQILNYSLEELSNKFFEKFNVKNRESKLNTWYQYSKSILSAATFLSKFKTIEDFFVFVSDYSSDSSSRLALPVLLSKEIHGMGFALACNFLKDIGCVDYAKPDVHILTVFNELGMCEYNDMKCFELMVKVSEEAGVSPFTVDKVMWLICSGNYHIYNKNLSPAGLRDKYIDFMKKNYLNVKGGSNVETKKGCIYILKNPSFPQFVKIGYADDVYQRLNQLNRSECIPYAFRLYAYYEVSSRLTDIKLHSLIDKLNPNLRAIDEFNGKKIVREFYAMEAEEAYSILETIAEINGMKDKLHKVEQSAEAQKDEEEANEIIELSINRHHFKDVLFTSSLTGKAYKGTTSETGVLCVIDVETNKVVPNNSNPSKKSIIGQAIIDLGGQTDKSETLYQRYRKLTKLVNSNN